MEAEEPQRSEWMDKTKAVAATLWRLSGAILLAYVFVFVLATASLQAGVAERLQKLQPAVDYSTGYAMWRRAEISGEKLAQLRGREEALIEAQENLQDAIREQSVPLIVGERRLRALQGRLKLVAGCHFVFDPDVNTVEEMLDELQECQQQPALSAAQKRAADELLASSPQLRADFKAVKHLVGRRAGVEEQLERVAASIKFHEKTTADLRNAREAFADLSALRRSWLVGGGVVTEFPPPVVQIMLAFVSGLFGALLVTLVLIVYPKSELRLSSMDGGYGARILLGGLISLCVFVVLGGGTAVLGTAPAFNEGEANFLAFCAIGILSGMFSDRAAHWLSERTDSFFGREDKGAGDPAKLGS